MRLNTSGSSLGSYSRTWRHRCRSCLNLWDTHFHFCAWCGVDSPRFSSGGGLRFSCSAGLPLFAIFVATMSPSDSSILYIVGFGVFLARSRLWILVGNRRLRSGGGDSPLNKPSRRQKWEKWSGIASFRRGNSFEKTKMQTPDGKLPRKPQSAELGTVSGRSCTTWDLRTDTGAESLPH